MFRIKTTRLDVGSGNRFLSITWKNASDSDPREGWMLQPCWRVQRGWWKYDKAIAGPFRTKKIAQEVKNLFREHEEWWR